MSDTGLRIKFFGRFEAWRGDVPIPSHAWPQRKTQLLLKFLVSERGRFFTQDQLIDALFSDLDPEKAAQSLRGRISEIRKVLEPELPRGTDSQFLIHAGLKGYCFSKTAPCSIDTELFQKELESAQRAEEAGRWSEALRGYEQTVAIYQGDYLAEDLYEEWTTAPRERWRELYLKALARLAECYARLRQFSRALECCQRVLEHAPWHEGIHRQKMLYHYHAGEYTQALQTYQTCTEALKTHLTVELSPETTKLHAQIIKHEVPELPQVFPNNLPRPLTSFIGREREVAEVKSLLATVRLLTLTGVGGCGKTRLALRVAADLLKEFPDGVWWVELAALADPMLVPHAAAEALDVKEEPRQALVKSLSDFLRRKNLLLVLDNCEHLLEASVQLTHELLQASPELSVLVTSRESLGLAGETVWPVPPLSVPDSVSSIQLEMLKQYEAVNLFVERARASQPGFKLTPENAFYVTQVCQQLDGIPLAIELAAARAKVLSVEQIAARLDDRFQLLTGGNRVALPRQQTLQATMDWSFQLLSEPERILLRRLSVFAGGFTLEAAESVCADDGPGRGGSRTAPTEVLDLLTQLVEKSLVVVQPGAQARYRLLETVRQYSLAKLQQAGEETRLHERHLGWFLALAEQAEPKLQESEQAVWLERLEREHDNLRTALEWSLREEKKAEAGLRLAAALGGFWRMRGYWSEGRAWLKEALPKSQRVPLDLRAKVLNAAGYLAWAQSDYAAAHSFFEECLAINHQLENRQGVAKVLNSLGIVATDQGDYVGARSVLEESLTICRELKLLNGMANCLNNLGNVADLQGNYSIARRYHEEGVTIRRELRDPWGLSLSLTNLANTLSHAGDDTLARRHYEEALALRREIGDRRGIAFTLSGLGNIALHQGDYATAARLYDEGLSIRQKLGEKRGMAISFECFARLAITQRQASRAVRLAGAADRLRMTIGAPRPPTERAEFALALQVLRAAMANAEYVAAWAEGQAMTLEQAIAYAQNQKNSNFLK